jgi:hypothetical protein
MVRWGSSSVRWRVSHMGVDGRSVSDHTTGRPFRYWGGNRGISLLAGGELLRPAPASPTIPRSASTRNAFSETQSIKVLPLSLGRNETLRLDNVATLNLVDPQSARLNIEPPEKRFRCLVHRVCKDSF